MNPSANKSENRPLPPRIVVDDPDDQLDGILGWIVRWCQLDNYGSTLLNRNAAISMKAVAVLLAVNFVFDLGAWWLLFNAVFGGGQGAFDLGVHSIFAMLFSLLISVVILIYERQFMTADISAQKSRFALPVLMRIVVIMMAAAITTQPVELMFFKGPIERRIHEESIRLEAVTRLKHWQEAEKRQSLAGVPDYYRENQKNAEEIKLQAEQKLRSLQSDLRAAESSQSRAQRWLTSSRARLSSVEQQFKDYWNRQVALAQDALSAATSKVESLKQQIGDQGIVVKNTETGVETAKVEVKTQVDSAVKESGRVRDWIAIVRQSKRGVSVTEPNGGDWFFRDQTYDFFEQLRVLSDLRNARPARWPEAGAEDREALAKTFNFKSPVDEESEAKIDAVFYAYSYWVVFGIAFVIPVLLLAFKLLQPQELRDYYSKREQNRARGFDVTP